MSLQSLRETVGRWWRSSFGHAAGGSRIARSAVARAGIRPGLYHFMYEAAGEATRFHLRVDSSGNGLLLAGASAAARLRPSGVIVAKGLLEGDEEPALLERLRRCFRHVPIEDARLDIKRVLGLIDDLAEPGDTYPIVNLADPTFTPSADRLDRPFSADVPLAEPARIVPLLDRMWDEGIPHVTFIAGDAPNPAHLVRAVERAEDLGMIAGVRARGSVLARGTLIHDLAQAGVDHLNVLYLAAEAERHDRLAGPGDHAQAVRAIGMARTSEVYPVAEIALTRSTVETAEATIRSLPGHGVGSAALFALAAEAGTEVGEALQAEELIQVAGLIEETADDAGLRLLWYPPVRFDPSRSAAKQVCGGPRASGDTSVRVEPDGAVIPARGPRIVGGNLLTDPWPRIHESPPFRQYRARVEHDTHCEQCPGLAICAADCPRSVQGWSDDRAECEPAANRGPRIASKETDDGA